MHKDELLELLTTAGCIGYQMDRTGLPRPANRDEVSRALLTFRSMREATGRDLQETGFQVNRVTGHTVHGPNARWGGPVITLRWESAVALAIRAGTVHGQKQRVFRVDAYGWTWTCDHCRQIEKEL